MMRATIFIFTIGFVCLLIPRAAMADASSEAVSSQTPAREGPPKPVARRLSTAQGLHLLTPEELRRVDRMQTVGHVLLGTGLGLSLAAIIVMEAVQWGTVAMAGFVTMGVGLATLISGMFLLGFSRPLHGYRPNETDQGVNSGQS